MLHIEILFYPDLNMQININIHIFAKIVTVKFSKCKYKHFFLWSLSVAN